MNNTEIRFVNEENVVFILDFMMYALDERFKQNIDKYGEGTAEFAAGAIAAYTKKI